MIGTRTPFRISFAGGGSDLKEFYRRHPGCVLSTTINRYMYIFVHRFFDERIQVKYAKTELVDSARQISHPIVREALCRFGITGIDINVIADVPAGTGLGSSGAFTVGLLNALHAYGGRRPAREALAREACEIETEILNEPIGKQDQYAAAYGGLNFILFHPDDTVAVEPVVMPEEKYRELEKNLLFFYLGRPRAARDILAQQQRKLLSDRPVFERVKRMADLARQLKDRLTAGDLQDVGMILDENWNLKKELSRKISDDQIDHYYDVAKKNGAGGGKLLGAGGGGFLMFYCESEHQEKVRRSLGDLREYSFKFTRQGTSVIFNADSESV